MDWESLTAEQAEAGARVHKLLVQMARSEDKVDEPRLAFLPRLDSSRHSRVLLIDGGRGSGKTALLLSVLSYWQKHLPHVVSVVPPKGLEGTADYFGRIVPVGLLDLHPIAPSTNMLLHVIGRFERVVEWLEGDGSRVPEPPAWHLAAEGVLASRATWKKLLRSVAASWDGGVEQRRGRLDIEGYTAELEEAERERLDLVSAYTAFMEALVDDFGKRQSPSAPKKPLFVLAVDDADMNPRRSVELLDMLRMLWHPRVAFVLTGDSELFEHTLAEHFLGELRRPLRGHGLRSEEISALAERRPVMRLASEVYEKVIPPVHRCQLAPIPVNRRLEDERVELGKVFARLELDATTRLTFADYFDREPQLREALPDRLRGLIDLAGQVTQEIEAPNHSPTKRTSRVVEIIWQQALRTLQVPLSGYDGDVILVDETTKSVKLRLSRLPPGIEVTRSSEIVHYEQPSLGLFVRLGAIQRFDAPLGQGRLLPRALTAALALAVNVAADQPDGTWEDVTTGFEFDDGDFGGAEYQQPGGLPAVSFNWPLHPGFSFPSIVAVSSRWKSKLRQLGGEKAEPWKATEEQIDELARHFLSLVIYIWAGARTLEIEKTTPNWDEIAQWLLRMIQGGTPDWRHWATRCAGLLAAPEYGLPASAANRWLAALSSEKNVKGRWPALRLALREERFARAEDVIDGPKEAGQQAEKRSLLPLDARPTQVLLTLDQTASEYDWGRVVEEGRQYAVPEAPMPARPPPAPAAVPGAAPPPPPTAAVAVVKRAAPAQAAGSSLIEFRQGLVDIGMTSMHASAAERLKSFGDDQLRHLTLATQPSTSSAAAMAALWHAATRLRGQTALAGLINVKKDKLIIKPLTISGLAIPGVTRPKNPSDAIAGHSLRLATDRATAYVWRLPEPTLQHDDNGLEPPLSALYEIIWDWHVRDQPESSGAPVFPAWWPGVGIAMPTDISPLIPWPTFQWSEYGRVRDVINAWNGQVNFCSGATAKGADQQRQIDVLAYFLVCASDPETTPSGQISSAYGGEWRSPLTVATTAERSPRRTKKAMARWLYGLYLMTAPESGLSSDVSAAILMELDREEKYVIPGQGTQHRYESFLGENANTSKPAPEPILRLRLERLIDIGLTEPDAEAALRTIDKAFATTHPLPARFREKP